VLLSRTTQVVETCDPVRLHWQVGHDKAQTGR
jgi:hypothetical protein